MAADGVSARAGQADRATPVALRPAEVRDHGALWAILAPAFRAGDTYAIDPAVSREAALAYWCGAGRTVWMAEAAGEILGTCYLRANAEGPGDHVANAGFVTHPAARGRGVAQAMLDHVLAAARAAGFRAMQFNCVVSTNTGAIRLWERAGFATVGRLPGGFRHPERGEVDALVMYRRF